MLKNEGGKMMKKLITIVLTLTLLLSLSALAFAADLKYDFSKGTDGWKGQAATTGEYAEGATEVESAGKLLKGTMKAGQRKYSFEGPADKINPDDTVTLFVYFPEDTSMKGFQIFRMEKDYTNWENSSWVNVKPGEWHEVTWKIPGGELPFSKYGIQLEARDDITEIKADEVIYIGSEKADIPAETDDEDEESPKTGYTSMLPLVLMAATSGAVLIKRRKK